MAVEFWKLTILEDDITCRHCGRLIKKSEKAYEANPVYATSDERDEIEETIICSRCKRKITKGVRNGNRKEFTVSLR